MIDLLQIASIIGALITIYTGWKFIVSPFQMAIKSIEETMRSLQGTITNLSFELKESQRDRQNIHIKLDKHEERIGKNEDAIIVNNERIATLFKQRGE